MQHRSVQLAFTVWWKSRKLVKTTAKRNVGFCQQKREVKKHRTEWCAAACTSKSQEHVNEWLREDSRHELGRGSNSHLEGTTW